MDAIDEKAEQEMWEARIPVIFNLAPHEVTTMEPPLSYCVLLPRMSYLPLVTKRVRDHFLPSAPAIEDEMWFEFNSTPLKWDLPIGVLFDLVSCGEELPMKITVHFQGFPTKGILRCRNLATVQAHFFNSLKECCYLIFSTAKAAGSLTQADHNELWKSVLQSDRTAHALVCAKLEAMFGANSREPKLPVRMLLSGFGSELNYDMRIIQRPLDPVGSEGAPQTLGSILRATVPTIVFAPEDDTTIKKNIQVLIQGIPVPLHTPAKWLCDHLRHPDLFLYISIVKVASGCASPRSL